MNEPETTRPAAAEPAAPEALPDLPCEVCRDLIPLVQDGAASPRSVQLVGRHIEHCESCRAFWQADAPPPRRTTAGYWPASTGGCGLCRSPRWPPARWWGCG